MATRLDDLTASTIRDAIAAAAKGRLDDAVRIGEQGLAMGGESSALHAMLGVFRLRTGDAARAVDHLTIAHHGNPADLVVRRNLAMALTQLGRHLEALELIGDDQVRADRGVEMLKLRGFLAQQAESFATAIACYERVVASDSADWESWNNLGNARRGIGDNKGAVEALRKAAELNPQSPPVRLNYATALDAAGEAPQAERELRRMSEDFPDDAQPLRTLFAMLRVQGRDDEAHDALADAVRRAPDDIELILGLASHRLTLLRHAEAEEAYRRVLSLDQSNKLAYLGVATVLDLTNRTEELAALVGQAERAGVEHEGLAFIRAFDHRRAKRYAQGLEELRQVPDELETGRRQQLLGQLLEGIGDYDAAYAAFERMNAIAADDPTEPEQRGRLYRDMIRGNSRLLTKEWASSWSQVTVDDRPSPVFLLGFPRSGTTLLDTILMSHPATQVMEEEPALARASDALGGMEAIAGASSKAISLARDVYFEAAQRVAPLQHGKRLIDKNPLASNGAPMIRRLFPDAKIILALRHPLDVVLSCFVTNFKPNNGMASFLRLDTAAELYDLTFSYFDRARGLLDLRVHEIVYENIVADRARELRPLFDFLELDWDERVLDHQSTARSRGHIKTASYAQVIEPIYNRSAGRWVHYRKYLDPIVPVLRPWIDKFGYAT